MKAKRVARELNGLEMMLDAGRRSVFEIREPRV